MNNVDPVAWLTQTLERIANARPSSEIDALMPCWGGRLPTASECARMSSLKAQSRETVRGRDYPNWYGYVKECVPIAWREHSRTTSPSQEAVAYGDGEILRESATEHHRPRSLRWLSSMGELLSTFGHEVKLVAPQLAKPYIKRGKNDAADAEALCEAMSRPTMRFVPVKTADQQAALMLVGVRERLIRNRTQLANAIRGLPWNLASSRPLACAGSSRCWSA